MRFMGIFMRTNSGRGHRGRSIGVSILLCGLAGLIPIAADAAEKIAAGGRQTVTIAYSSISGNMAPLWITYERGFFRKYGLEARLVFIESGSSAVKGLVSTDVAFAQMAGPAVVQSRLQGSDVVMIAGVLNTLDYQLIVNKNITNPDQLKGKAMAVSRFGSSSDFATRYALDKFGLVPQRDVRILEIGSQPARFAALETGKVQAVMMSVPLTVKAKAAGFRALADLQMLGLEYQHTGLATTQALISSQPDLVRNVMKAYVEGIHYYKTRRKESLAILAKYLNTRDTEALDEIYDELGRTLVPMKPYPTVKGIDVILQELRGREPKAKTVQPEQFVDLTFVKDLDSSGFIDRLYKTAPASVAGEEERPADARPGAKEKSEEPSRAAKRIEPATAAPSRATVKDYTVRAGDTLSHLALDFYGASSQWTKIYDANRQVIRNPNYIYIGQKITIPSVL